MIHDRIQIWIQESLINAQSHPYVCGPAVYFVLTHGDLQRPEWTFCYSVV